MQVPLKPVHKHRSPFVTLLQQRTSCRSFQNTPLSLADISVIAWAACGKQYDALSSPTKTTPSAGGCNPLELFLVVGTDAVKGLSAGVYMYQSEEHSLRIIQAGDLRGKLAQFCLEQMFITEAPVSLVIVADMRRTTSRYGVGRGQRYVYMEIGHASQNVYVMAESLGLATVEVGAFQDQKIADLLDLEASFSPLSVMPIGYRR